MWKKMRSEKRKVHAAHAIWTKHVYGLNGRRAPQVTPQPANLPCQNTMVILTSWGNSGRCRLTPEFPIKHKNKTIWLTRGSQLTPKGALPLACLNVRGA